MKEEFWIIEEDRIGDFKAKKKKTFECYGPIYSIEKAEKRLRKACSDSFKSSEHDNLEKESCENHCSKFKIVQTLKTLHPILVVNIKTKLKKI
jgi:hypothetical protein